MENQTKNKDYFLSDLNTNQKKAVLHINGALAIIAGAGSGKTRTLTRKIAYLIDGVGIAPSRILAVTFTNKAANEMKERVISLIGKHANAINVMTYHSFCAMVLRTGEISRFGFNSNFSIIDTIDQKQILRRLYEKYNINLQEQPINALIDFISRHKILGTNPSDDPFPVPHQTKLVNVFNDYNQELKRTNSVDFDDLIIYTNKLLKKLDIASKWAKKYDYILIDEFQDTSLIQYEIIQAISFKNNITIVGDPDQTIYTWRWADVNLINNFKKYFPNSKIIKLEQNYRSTPNILNAANNLISYNKNRIHKNLFTINPVGEDIEYYHGFSDEMECKWIISKILELKVQKVQLKDIAILYRSSFVSRPIEHSLLEQNINYIIFNDVAFYQRAEIKDVMAFLKVIYNGNDLALTRIINIPARGIGVSTLEKFRQISIQNNISLFQAILENYQSIRMHTKQKANLVHFLNLIRKYRLALSTKYKDSPHIVIKKFLIESGYWKMQNDLLEKNRLENIEELIISIENWTKKNPKKTLDDYFNDISLLSSSNTQGIVNDYISLMTVHAAKGLEFPYVFILGFSEPVFPSSRTINFLGESGLEEERRLAYVAITRAMKKLFVSSSQGKYIDQKTSKEPSRFLKEMKVQIKTKHFDFTITPQNLNFDHKDIKVGDKIRHLIFGDGVVINANKDQLEIKFNLPHGIKTLMRFHKSIERIG